MKILNSSKASVIAQYAGKADTFLSRLTGLLGKDNLKPGQGLVIGRCNSIHMFFMKFPIDAIFVGRENRVVGLVENIKPFQVSPIFWQGNFVIEVGVGVIKNSNTALGDLIRLED